MENSGLRGLGGAGFPAGRKWKLVAAEPAPRLMAINIDEGEPGTFKDRYYLERDPHRFLEGALIAAWAVGIEAVYVYLRDEYHGCRAILQQEIAALQADPPCPLPPSISGRGAGAYICGEESSMIESIEGKRGEPRLRPPYVAQVGLFDRPTLEHNMETLHWVRAILENGPSGSPITAAMAARGCAPFSVSGRVKKPGVHLAPAGITLRELVDEYCGGMLDGHELYGYLPGGASGGILPASKADVPLDFDTLNEYGCFIGSAAIVVLSNRDTAGGRGAQPDEVLLRRVVRAVHALPRRDGEGARPDARPALGCAPPERAVAGDDGRVDLRPGPGGAQPGADGAEVLFPKEVGVGLKHRRTPRCRRTIPVSVTLNGRPWSGGPIMSAVGGSPHEQGIEIPRLCYLEGDAGRRQLPAPAWVEIQGRAGAGLRRAAAYPKQGMEVTTRQRTCRHQPEDVDRACCSRTCPRPPSPRDSELDLWAKKLDHRQTAASAPGSSQVEDLSHPAMAVHLDACIQCNRLRARVPRRAGERRHRLRLPRRLVEDRVRPRRPDGRLHLRRVRRVRAGVPDRRADAGPRSGQGRARQAGGLGVPLLRCGLSAHLQHQGQHRSSTCRARTAPPTPADSA
jgi:hypothetical protein